MVRLTDDSPSILSSYDVIVDAHFMVCENLLYLFGSNPVASDVLLSLHALYVFHNGRV